MSWFNRVGPNKLKLPEPDQALPGREAEMPIPDEHFVLKTPLQPPFPDNFEIAMFGMGCFWGAEKLFWEIEGVHSTMVGYAAGFTPNPTYEEVCSGKTGHNEVVQVVFDPKQVSYTQLLKVFWESHNPTEGMQQGNDVGTQYRSGIYVFSPEQQELAEMSKEKYQSLLTERSLDPVTSEIVSGATFYYAEPYHQQYLAKNVGGYCPNHTCAATGLPTIELPE